jgi:hypothetical protein
LTCMAFGTSYIRGSRPVYIPLCESKRSQTVIFSNIYQSYRLECSLNTLGIRGAVHDSCVTKSLAEHRFRQALAGGRTKIITPMYTP